MKKLFILIFTVFLFVSCADYSGGNGNNAFDAVIVHENNREEGMKLMQEWIEMNFPGSEIKKQKLFFFGGNVFYKVTIKTKGDAVMPVYFDVSEFMELKK